jgi:hypothetical protein
MSCPIACAVGPARAPACSFPNCSTRQPHFCRHSSLRHAGGEIAEIDALVAGAGFAERASERLYRRHLTSYFAAARDDALCPFPAGVRGDRL